MISRDGYKGDAHFGCSLGACPRSDLTRKAHKGLDYIILLSLLLLLGCSSTPVATPALSPTPVAQPSGTTGASPTGDANSLKLYAVLQLVGAILQGKPADATRPLLDQVEAQARSMGGGETGFFFFDFADPNLPLNQFAAEVARDLLYATPLYVLAYLVFLVWNIWKEKPIPNPIVYAVLVLFVMLFLAAFAVITQGLTQVGSAIAAGIAGQDTGPGKPGWFDLMIGALEGLQASAGLLAIPALLIAIVEFFIILIQLLYRGISMAVWRLVGLVLIPLSVLLEGVQAKTAGRVIGGFFEAWIDIVGKVGLLFVVLALAGSKAYSGLSDLILPAGLLIVILSWKFVGLFYTLLRNAVANNWAQFAPAEVDTSSPMTAAAERARAARIDEERRDLLQE